MKNYAFSILFLCLLCFFSGPLRAAHLIGGEITYKCLGDDQAIVGNKIYEFKISVYRDCYSGGAVFDGAPGGADMHLTFYRGSNDMYEPVDFLNATGVEGVVLLGGPVAEDIPPGVSSPCVEIPSNLCVEKGEYVFEQSLPVISEDYYIVYQRCCRNGTINNIVNPEEAGANFSIVITAEAQQSCNSSPTFTNFPDVLICVDKPLNFDHSATDDDGDQLVYRFCDPLSGGSVALVAPNPDLPPPFDIVDYLSPTYTMNKPLAGDPVVSIDPNTGLITGVPNIQGQHVVSICVDEYRAGELLSTVQRDFQFNITDCTNLVDAFIEDEDGVNQKELDLVSCVDSSIVISNTSVGGSFIENYFWSFVVGEGTDTLTATTRDLNLTFPGPGTYLGQMFLNKGIEGCSDSVNVNVYISQEMKPDFITAYDTCEITPVAVDNLSDTNDIGYTSMLWDFGDGDTSIVFSTEHQYEMAGTYSITLTLIDSFGCTATKVDSIAWFPKPNEILVELDNEYGCPPLEVSFLNATSVIDTNYLVEWNFGDGISFGEGFNPTTVYQEQGYFDVSVAITSPLGCYKTDTFTNLVFVDSLPVADFVYSPTELDNFNNTAEFTDNSYKAVEWKWDFAGIDSSFFQNNSFTFPDTGKQNVTLMITSFYGCKDTVSQVVDIVPKIRYFLPNAFTPNDDELNDIFEPVGYFRGIYGYQMMIWNRYGELIFESDDPTLGWNGQMNGNGKLVQSGVYLYKVSFFAPRTGLQVYEGKVTVIK